MPHTMPSQPVTDYGHALQYVNSFTDYEKKGFATYAPEFYNLDRVHELLALLGDPQHTFRAVHIAGTKGKGSTAAMIESILRTAGYRTGLYTSPHLHTFRERIQVAGELIPEADVVRLVRDSQELIYQVQGITTFEVITALAFLWFAEQGVEWAVLEVGLGGRLDATNVIVPDVSVITSISLDHTEILGDTLGKIATEKAGIVKEGIPVVCAPQESEALTVIEATCRRLQAPLTLVGRDWTWQPGPASLEGQAFELQHGKETMAGLWLSLLGEHQLENAATAVAAVMLLAQQGIAIPEKAVRDGLRAVHWPGRFEILARDPLVIADSAHNGDSARKLVATIEAHCRYRRLILILGASAHHANADLLNTLLSRADRAIATQARHPRAAEPDWLQAQGQALGYDMQVTTNVPDALRLALAQATPEDLIVGAGSVFVAAEMREAWLEDQKGLDLPSDPL